MRTRSARAERGTFGADPCIGLAVNGADRLSCATAHGATTTPETDRFPQRYTDRFPACKPRAALGTPPLLAGLDSWQPPGGPAAGDRGPTRAPLLLAPSHAGAARAVVLRVLHDPYPGPVGQSYRHARAGTAMTGARRSRHRGVSDVCEAVRHGLGTPGATDASTMTTWNCRAGQREGPGKASGPWHTDCP